MVDIKLDTENDLEWVLKDIPPYVEDLADAGQLVLNTASDIDYDYSDFVNVVDLLEAKKGEIRQYPMAGANIKSFQMSRYDQQKMDSIVKENLILDKWKPNSITVTSKGRETLEVDATRLKRND